MKNDIPLNSELFVEARAEQDQFCLASIQTYNWGTFSGVTDYPVARRGYLIVGPSGAGKSTVLDVHAALLTPPKWLAFNVAAREGERGSADRNLVSYVRGQWAEKSSDEGEAVRQYLRLGTTFSAISETYRNGRGDVVVLAIVFWIRGTSTASADIKRQYFVLEREFDVRELQVFAENDFDVRKLKASMPDAFIRDEFSPYQERFRRLLGIENESALRLLHKTQSAKNIGDLNAFLRDFMLEVPETFGVAESLVAEFRELNEAHQAVVNARLQRDTLRPAQEEHAQLDEARLRKNELDELSAGVDKYREQQRKRLREAAIEELELGIEGATQEVLQLEEAVEREFSTLRELQDRRAGMGGRLIEQLQQQVLDAERERLARHTRRETAAAACTAMGWTLATSAAAMPLLVRDAKERLESAEALANDLEARQDALKETQRQLQVQFAGARAEIAAMERQRSNIPARMLAAREAMAQTLGIPEDKLPFAGELIEVRQDCIEWQGAIERVLGAFGVSLLVEDRHYPAVAEYVNETTTGVRLVYLRVVNQISGNRGVTPKSLVRKLNIAPGAHAQWLLEELKTRFDYECVDSLEDFRFATRGAVTIKGQVKHNTTRHEKDDRAHVGDRSRYVLGFDNKAKLELYRGQAAELGSELGAILNRLSDCKDERSQQQDALRHCQTLANLVWADIDVAGEVAKIASLTERIDAEKEARPDLARLDEDIKRQAWVHKKAVDAKGVKDSAIKKWMDEVANHRRQLAQLRPELLSPTALTPFQLAGLEERYLRPHREMALDTLSDLTVIVIRTLGQETEEKTALISRLGHSIERRFAEFIRLWPSEAGGLDATLLSADDFFAKLSRLETDGLPRFEARFLSLLRDQSDQNLTRLSSRLEQERKAILDRLDQVNTSLRTAEFNPGTHLVIEPTDKSLEDVRQFKASLKGALTQAFSDDPLLAEQRFEVLKRLVNRLSSQEAADKHWRALVLDVRQHFEFLAREFNELGQEVEIYRSGAGKSGGQRQKLTATCLAAALRYQLGGAEGGLPSFATIFMDEAFDKADADYTALTMNIFKTFGFQLVVATPLKNVMALEPFIGGACYISIRDRKVSTRLLIEYNDTTGRLALPDHLHDTQEPAAA